MKIEIKLADDISIGEIMDFMDNLKAFLAPNMYLLKEVRIVRDPKES